jgi:hypothetical protein
MLRDLLEQFGDDLTSDDRERILSFFSWHLSKKLARPTSRQERNKYLEIKEELEQEVVLLVTECVRSKKQNVADDVSRLCDAWLKNEIREPLRREPGWSGDDGEYIAAVDLCEYVPDVLERAAAYGISEEEFCEQLAASEEVEEARKALSRERPTCRKHDELWEAIQLLLTLNPPVSERAVAACFRLDPKTGEVIEKFRCDPVTGKLIKDERWNDALPLDNKVPMKVALRQTGSKDRAEYLESVRREWQEYEAKHQQAAQ